MSENYTDADRAAFLAALDTLNTWTPPLATNADSASVRPAAAPVAFVNLAPEARGALIDAIEHAPNRRAEPMRTYWRLKGLVIHGYFTSERVSKDVLHVEVMPGRFDGSAPMAVRTSGAGGHRHE